jgi:hypothetical protein
MTNNQAKHGGKREGSGRTTDYLQRCKLLALQLDMVCSESTARRWLKDNGGQIKGLVSQDHFEVLEAWSEMSEFDQGMVDGLLSARVQASRKEGWGRRL